MKKITLLLFVIGILSCQSQTTNRKPTTSNFEQGSNSTISNLTPERIDNLELLGKIWGFLKYHHPAVAKGTYQWDYELFAFLPKYLETTTNDRDQLLLEWIQTLGEVPACKKCTSTSNNAQIKPNLNWIEHHKLKASLKEVLQHIYRNRHQGKQQYVSIKPFTGNPQFKEETYPAPTYPDDGYRLLALYRYWNIIHYFFPYKHITDKNWDTTLKEYIPLFINAKNELEYELAAIKIIGDVQDTHATLWEGNDKLKEWKGKNLPPFRMQFIEDQLVVIDYYNEALKQEKNIEIGDIITTIEGQPIETFIKKLSPITPVSNKASLYRKLASTLLRSNKDSIDVGIIRNGKKASFQVAVYPRKELDLQRWFDQDKEQRFYFLDHNIGYLSVKHIEKSDISKIKKEFINAKGIIIDLRHYPNTYIPYLLGSYFVEESTPFVKFTVPNKNNPGEFTFSKPLSIPPSKNPYTGKVVVLVNENSQSQSEYTAMAFQAGVHTTVIGSTTAGADGDVSEIELPGGLVTMISGIGVYYPDGTETQRVGIIPDIKVIPTIQGIKNGKDDVLEAAKAFILKD
ncbi:S41 family peptidase [uncultured Dokdonia sp.]|uniref:S41 family peptidase n=1 Tax=uncultured Dokdonia sp. TaxID=575653 RepID=UPI00261ADB32|nr:S41 family peptidase [uncultured Dokdonia sp.]